ncbi:MAG: hypothetical protein RI601_06270 [Desulfurivibrionaceae bacterium]|nr:hypothetical protein [Desulfurivibrionaceae bacterium]
MALLTLQRESAASSWPNLEEKLADWGAELALVEQSQESRTYQGELAPQGQLLPILMELQDLLAGQEVHFFLDLKS